MYAPKHKKLFRDFKQNWKTKAVSPYTTLRKQLSNLRQAGRRQLRHQEVLFHLLFFLLLFALFYYFFHKTKWGIAIQATSEDPVAAQLMGIAVKRVYGLVWIFSAIVATISGILLAPRMSLLDTSMGFLGLKAFPAAVLGGFGSITGAIAGGIMMGVIETISMGTLSFYFSWIKEINDIIVWIVLIAILMVKPDGLFGVEKVRKV